MDVIKLSIQRPIFISMVTLFTVVMGIIFLQRLPIDLYPDVAYPVLSVSASLTGAAPEDMEQLVTKKMEDALSTIAGVQLMRSTSREGTSVVTLEFNPGEDVRFQEMQVRAKVANIRKSLPEDLSEPVVRRQDPNDTAIIELAVTGERTATELTDLVDKEIARKIAQIKGVGEVDLGGDRRREIQVELKHEILDSLRIGAQDIVNAIRSFNRSDPVGALEGPNKIWTLRSMSTINTPMDFGRIRIGEDRLKKPVFLRDVAEIVDGFEEVRNITLMSQEGKARPAILVSILKQSGENSLDISNKVRAALDELKQNLPHDINIRMIRDSADLVRSNVDDVVESLVIGSLLTIFVVLVFLRSPRSTITTGLALPNSMIATFAAMAAAGFTINIMTLLALSLAVGLVVDDAIVVRENIFRHLSEEKRSPKDAADIGTRQVILAVLATTLTIVAVFVPVGFMTGLTGQFFRQFAFTVVFAVLVSTWDAITMAPMLSAYFAHIADPKLEWAKFGNFGKKCFQWLEVFEHRLEQTTKRYQELLIWLLPKPKVAIVATAISLVIAGIGFVMIPKNFLPTQLGKNFDIMLTGPLGVAMPALETMAKAAHEKMTQVEGLEFWTIRATRGFNGAAQVRLSVKVDSSHAKNQKQLAAVRQKSRQILQDFPGYKVRLSEPSDPLAGSSGRFQPLAVQVAGDDVKELRRLGDQMRELLSSIPGVVDVTQPDDQALPEVRLTTDPLLAALYGTNAQAIGDTLRIWVSGDTSSYLRINDDQVPVRVRLANGRELPPSQILAYNTYNRQGTQVLPIPLQNVTKWDVGAGPPLINRESRQKILRVGANLTYGTALGDAASELEAKLAEIPLPAGYSARIVGQNEQMSGLLKEVLWAVILGSIFIYMVLASLFESLTHPLTVMMAIPLAGIGAVLALWGTGSALDLYAGIGMILLAGIVAKNSILLVDFAIQRCRETGEDPTSAIIQAAPLRLRPILMTSVAMIAGMLPIATGLGSGGAARQTLGIAAIGGIISSTLLTLIIVPNFFVFVEKINRALSARRHKV